MVDTSSETVGAGAPLVWRVLMSRGAAPRFAGCSFTLRRNAPVDLGRGSEDFGAGALASKRVSKQHVRFSVEADDRLVVRDLDSHNGVRVDGTSVTTATLRHGSVVAFGGVLLHTLRVRADALLGRSPNFVGIGPTVRALDDALRELTTERRDVLVIGAAGSGKDHFVETLHGFASAGRLKRIQAADDRTPAADDQLLEDVGSGVLYIDGVEHSTVATLRLLRRLLLGESRSGVRVAASMRGPAESSTIPPELLARLGRWTVVLPKLADRREDIPAFVQTFCAARGLSLQVHPRALELLCLRDWPSNLHELEAVLARAWARVGEDGVLSPSLLDVEVSATVSDEQRIEIRRDGDWFVAEGGQRVELGGRPTVRRLLAALVRSHGDDRYHRLNAAELGAAGWPDENSSSKAVTNRVYTAMSTLRSLGLRSVIDRSSEGYRLSPEVVIRIID